MNAADENSIGLGDHTECYLHIYKMFWQSFAHISVKVDSDMFIFSSLSSSITSKRDIGRGFQIPRYTYKLH